MLNIINDFKVMVHEGQDETFTTSYQHPLTKKRVRMSFLSKEDASSYKKKMEAKFKKSQFESYENATIEELLMYFMKEVPENPFNFKFRNYHLIDFIETFGDFGIYEVTTRSLKQWMDQVQVEGHFRDIRMRGIKCDMNTFFAFLVDKEIISESPLSTIYYKVLAPSVKSRNLLSPKEIQELLAATKDHSPGYLYPLVKIFQETAAKSIEVIDLNWDQVDLEKGLVSFNKRNKAQARTLKLSDELIHMLRIKKKQKTEKERKVNGENEGEEEREGEKGKSTRSNKSRNRVFMTYYKEPFTYEKLRSAVNEFKRKKLYKGAWVIGDLRHSFAVNFLSEGGDMKELQRILGHGNIFDTKRLYGEASQSKNIALGKSGNSFDGISETKGGC